MMENTYLDLNAEVNLWDENGRLQLDKDKDAARSYFREHVNKNTVFFHNLKEKTDYLVEQGHWSREVVEKFSFEDFKALFKYAYSFKHRFDSLLGALKFYSSYALKTVDEEGTRYLERFEDRVVMNAVEYSDDLDHAYDIVEAIITKRYQPATPTFMNAGRANWGAPVSCFLLRLDDNLESISRAQTDASQLSKRGGGVGLLLSNIREEGAPIKGKDGVAKGVVPIMKILEDTFSYVDQLGARQGAGAVYLNAHHPDIMKFLDTKRENADEKIRIKTLSLGVVLPDITFELAKNNEDMYLFSPYDVERVYGVPFSEISVTDEYRKMVEDPRIRKSKVNTRRFFQTLAEVQFESGYPYIMYEDTVNRANPAPNVGKISMSNLCSEIFQPQTPSTFNEAGEFAEVGRDISCNLGSLNIDRVADLPRGDFHRTVQAAYKMLTNVSEQSNDDLSCSPTIRNGNERSRAIGLGQMNLHGALIRRGLKYDSEEAKEFFRAYMADVTYVMLESSRDRAVQSGEVFDGFHGSRWEDGSKIEEMIEATDFKHPNVLFGRGDWDLLKKEVEVEGLYNQHLQAIPPTGSISYINGSTSSIHPITAKVEARKEGRTGRLYYPAYGLTDENFDQVQDAYDIGPEAIIDMYAVAQPYVDQGMSLTLFFKDTATTRDINRAQRYAHKAGVKSLYYVRMRNTVLSGTEMEACVSCTL